MPNASIALDIAVNVLMFRSVSKNTFFENKLNYCGMNFMNALTKRRFADGQKRIALHSSLRQKQVCI